MPYSPQTTDEVYEDLREYLTNETDELTDFTTGSLNRVLFRQGFSNYWTEFEHARLATQLSGWIEYAGGPIDDDDIQQLGLGDRIEEIDIDLLNSFLDDEDLDALAANVGISRDPGDFAEGEVLFELTTDRVVIPAGSQVATEVDADGSTQVFETTEEVRPIPNTTTVPAPIVATELGSAYNVGSNQIERFVTPLPGVESVTNPQATSEGQDAETNSELRQRAKNALISSSGGGTTGGIRGYIIDNIDGIEQGDVILDEHYDGQPSISATNGAPYVDVVVDGGTMAELDDALESSRSSGMYHRIVRPTVLDVDMTIELRTDGSVDTDVVENVAADYVSHAGIGESVFRDRLIQNIMNTDSNIVNINELEMTIRDEPHTYQTGTDVYTLESLATDPENGGIVEVTGVSGGSQTTFVNGTDYDESFAGNSEGHVSGIDWSVGGSSPDDGTDFLVDYVVLEDISISDNKTKAVPSAVTVTTV